MCCSGDLSVCARSVHAEIFPICEAIQKLTCSTGFIGLTTHCVLSTVSCIISIMPYLSQMSSSHNTTCSNLAISSTTAYADLDSTGLHNNGTISGSWTSCLALFFIHIPLFFHLKTHQNFHRCIQPFFFRLTVCPPSFLPQIHKKRNSI